MEQGKKKIFEVGVFKQGDVLKQMFQKGHKKVLECIWIFVMQNFQELTWKIEFMGKWSWVYISL